MFDGTQELAENKLLILYILDQVNRPLSNSRLTEIILENSLLNYFHLQQYLGELVSSGFLSPVKEEKRLNYHLSEKGRDVLDFFKSRISDNKKELIDTYLENKKELIDKDMDIIADFLPGNKKDYIVSCRLTDGSKCLIELKLNASSSEQAMHMCSNWKANALEIYNKIKDIIE